MLCQSASNAARASSGGGSIGATEAWDGGRMWGGENSTREDG
jgi:hypothetical protein